MKIGKIPESVLKRSVLKQIQNTGQQELVSGAAVGADCAILAFPGEAQTAACVQEVAVTGPFDVERILHRTANSLVCAGAKPVAVLISLLLPETAEEAQIQELMGAARAVCEKLSIAIAGGQTNVSRDIGRPHMSVTGIGRTEGNQAFLPGGAKPGQDIVISKWIGLEGTAMLAEAGREKLAQRYPARLVEEAVSFGRYLSVLPEARAALQYGVSALHDVSEGGIFRALWEVAECSGTGLTVDLKKIPIRQETVEVCEFFQTNPYELLSGGSLIMVTEDGEGLAEALKLLQIPARVVGQITDSHDRVIVNEEETRYLDRPRAEEIYKVL